MHRPGVLVPPARTGQAANGPTSPPTGDLARELLGLRRAVELSPHRYGPVWGRPLKKLTSGEIFSRAPTARCSFRPLGPSAPPQRRSYDPELPFSGLFVIARRLACCEGFWAVGFRAVGFWAAGFRAVGFWAAGLRAAGFFSSGDGAGSEAVSSSSADSLPTNVNPLAGYTTLPALGMLVLPSAEKFPACPTKRERFPAVPKLPIVASPTPAARSPCRLMGVGVLGAAR